MTNIYLRILHKEKKRKKHSKRDAKGMQEELPLKQAYSPHFEICAESRASRANGLIVSLN